MRYNVVEIHEGSAAEFCKALISKGNDPDFVDRQYREWKKIFSKNVSAFYMSQYSLFEDLALRDFASKQRVCIDDVIYCDTESLLWYQWRNYKQDSGYQAAIDLIHHCLDNNRIQDVQAISDLSDAHDQMTEFLNEVRLTGTSKYFQVSLRDFTRQWFDHFIDTDLDEQIALKQLAYAEYLKSSHWQKVRAAMLVISNARCQAVSCWQSGDTFWLGYERELHIHHLNYKNKGNERFDDLLVLCNRHHEQWHDEKKAGKVHLEIVQNDPFDIF